MNEVLLARGLCRYYGPSCPCCVASTGPSHDTNICPRCGTVVALADVTLRLRAGEVLGVIGESGSGKSTLLRLLHLDELPDAGELTFEIGQESHQPYEWNARERRLFRAARLSIVHQNPVSGLNFRLSAGGNVAERLLASGYRSFNGIRAKTRTLLARTDFPVARLDEKPSRFSGGMQQRVQIAKALACRPVIAFLDEVTSALDPSVQARILDLLAELQQELDMSMVIVTHDVNVIRVLADRAIVLKTGRIVEEGLSDQILEDPQHAFTQELVAAAS